MLINSIKKIRAGLYYDFWIYEASRHKDMHTIIKINSIEPSSDGHTSYVYYEIIYSDRIFNLNPNAIYYRTLDTFKRIIKDKRLKFSWFNKIQNYKYINLFM